MTKLALFKNLKRKKKQVYLWTRIYVYLKITLKCVFSNADFSRKSYLVIFFLFSFQSFVNI